MSWCAVINCHNKTKNNRDVSYFQLPSEDNNIRKAWIHALGRPISNLPNSIIKICSEHFEEKCFDPSWALQNRLYYKDRKIKRMLIPGSIPTLNLAKSPTEPRASSEKRSKAKTQKEVNQAMLVQ